jgi:hypothetical protein
MNQEQIIRKLIFSNMLSFKEHDGSGTFYLYWGPMRLSRTINPDETINQVVDWFYYQILQSSMEELEA